MVNLMNILRRPATTAADLRKMLEEIDQPAAEAAVADAEATRRQALLGGTDAAVDKAEKSLTDARRSLDRLLAAKSELEARIPQAETAERDAALAAKRAEIIDEADAVVKTMKDRWPKIVAEAGDLLERLDAVEERAKKFNWLLYTTFGLVEPPGMQVPTVERRLGFFGEGWNEMEALPRTTRIRKVLGGPKGWPR